jgi:phosphatidylglycerophosphatase A
VRVPARRVLRDPVLFLGFGFGSGLAPRAPGTAGSLVALPLVAGALTLGPLAYALITLGVVLAGIWLCGESARRIDAHDHPGIVWDEFAGMLVTFLGAANDWPTLLLGFVLFRFFDILKPWPIRELDHSIHGGLGIMLDDVVAGVFAAIALLAARAAIGLL